jgi:polyisoprenoid-binding protein YceI
MTTIAATSWAIDQAHSEVSFKVKHLMISNVKGTFGQFEGSVITAGNDFNDAEIDFKLNASSIHTGDAQRDGHLKGSDFFDAENYPFISFKSTSMTKLNDDHYSLTGHLTIKDKTLPVTLKAEYGGTMKDPWGNEKSGFTVSGKINRKDWGLNWNAALETGGVLVSEEVALNADIQLLKK